MQALLDTTLRHLERLVACDSRNPPRALRADGDLFGYLRAQLAGFDISVRDHGDGCISMLALRGRPSTLFNFHLDTVPANEQWSFDPLSLQLREGRAWGLGACDIKGAAAAMLSAAAASDGPLALLFSSDEEAGSSTCIRQFLAEQHGFSRAVIAEPTGARAVCAHRGIATARLVFRGVPGHASAERALADSAVHRAVQWGNAALEAVRRRQQERFENLAGLRFNIGRIEGGIKPNMIAGSAELLVGMRTLPGQDGQALMAQLAGMAPAGHLQDWELRFLAPALPDAARAHQGLADSQRLAASLGLPPGPAVDYWTEAALFAEAGLDAIVYGSGDIDQAHTADEWVSLEQLDTVANTYKRLIDNGFD